MYAQQKITGILVACIIVTTVGVQMAIGDGPATVAAVNDVLATYECSASVTTAPGPDGDGVVTFTLTATDDNGADDIPTDKWKADWDGGQASLEEDSSTEVSRTFSGTRTILRDRAAGSYTVTLKHDHDEVCTATFVIESTVALVVDFSTVDFGSLDPGASSTVSGDENMNTDKKPTIQNVGNMAVDVQMGIDGDLYEGHTDVTMAGVTETLTTSVRTFGISIAPDGKTAMDFTLTVPVGTGAGSYSGTLTIEPV